jgi:hypothetical protein
MGLIRGIPGGGPLRDGAYPKLEIPLGPKGLLIPLRVVVIDLII